MATLLTQSFISNKLSHFTLNSPTGGILISIPHVMTEPGAVMWLLGAKAGRPGAAHRGRFPGRAPPRAARTPGALLGPTVLLETHKNMSFL